MGWFQRLSDGLSKTRQVVRQSLDRVLGRTPDPAMLEDLEGLRSPLRGPPPAGRLRPKET